MTSWALLVLLREQFILYWTVFNSHLFFNCVEATLSSQFSPWFDVCRSFFSCSIHNFSQDIFPSGFACHCVYHWWKLGWNSTIESIEWHLAYNTYLIENRKKKQNFSSSNSFSMRPSSIEHQSVDVFFFSFLFCCSLYGFTHLRLPDDGHLVD